MFNEQLVGPLMEDFFFNNYPPEKILLMIKNKKDIVDDLNEIGQQKPFLLKNFMIVINNWGEQISSEKLIESSNGKEQQKAYNIILKSQIGNKWITRQLMILKSYTQVYCQQNGIPVKNCVSR